VRREGAVDVPHVLRDVEMVILLRTQLVCRQCRVGPSEWFHRLTFILRLSFETRDPALPSSRTATYREALPTWWASQPPLSHLQAANNRPAFATRDAA